MTKAAPKILLIAHGYEELVKKRPNLNVLFLQPGDVQSHRSEVAECEIIVGFNIFFREYIPLMPKLKWAHSTSAGVDAIFRPKKLFSGASPPWTLTRTRCDFHGVQISEYVIGQVVGWERKFRQLAENQKQKHWVNDDRYSKYPNRELNKVTMCIVGSGGIGNRVAKTCKFFGMRVLGIGQRLKSRTDPNMEFYDEIGITKDLPAFLSQSDYACSILPKTDSTNGIFDGDMLQNCENKKTIFMNVGRGNVVKNSTIIQAINEKWIGGAILDVFEPEPIAQDDPIWETENVIVTPHLSATGNLNEIADCFLKNYDQFVQGKQLIDLVDVNSMY